MPGRVMGEVVPPPFRYCPACGVRLAAVLRTQDLTCTECGFRYYHNVASGVAAFLTCGTRLLVVRRAAAPAAGTCDLPGGFVGAGETLEQALARELAEELGLTRLPASPSYLFSLPNRYRYADVEYATADVFFHLACDELPLVVAGDDAANATWLELAEVEVGAFGLDSVRAAVVRFLAQPAR